MTDYKSWKVNHKLHANVVNLPHGSAGRAVAAAAKVSVVPKAIDRAQSQQAEHTPAVKGNEEALPCEAATFGTQHGIPAVSSSDRLAQSSVSKSPQPSFDSRKAEDGIKVLTAASPQTAIDSLHKQEAVPSGTHAALPASPQKHSAGALAKPQSVLAGTLTPTDVKGKPGLEPAETLLMVQRLPAVLSGSLPTAESLGLQLSMPSTTDVLRKSPCLSKNAWLLRARDHAGWSLSVMPARFGQYLARVLRQDMVAILVPLHCIHAPDACMDYAAMHVVDLPDCSAGQIPRPASQGSHNPAVQHFCTPGMLKGLQAELWPQKLLVTDAITDMHNIAADIDAASWVVCSSQHVNTARYEAKSNAHLSHQADMSQKTAKGFVTDPCMHAVG